MLALVFPSGVRVGRWGDYVGADWTGAATRDGRPMVVAGGGGSWDVALVVDVDVPRPVWPFLHWAVRRDGPEVVPWTPLRPPRDGTPHRYRLILFRLQPGMLSPTRIPDWLGAREAVDVRRLLNAWHLDPNPVAILEFQSAHAPWPSSHSPAHARSG